MHAHSIMHRDVKPENILVDDVTEEVKIADFGWSNIFERDEGLRSTFCGTLDYLAPEMIKSCGHDVSVDIWSLGVLLYELLCGKSPFGSASQEETCVKILGLDMKPIPIYVPDVARDLIMQLLKPNPGDRLGIDEVLESAFVKEFAPCPKEAKKLHKGKTSPADSEEGEKKERLMPLDDDISSIELRRVMKRLQISQKEKEWIFEGKRQN